MKKIKKVITASAGTGKTFRLSLEFINLLLEYKNIINFDEIIVITFTNKAAAEIRQRIISHLKILSLEFDSSSANILKESILSLSPNLIFDNETQEYLTLCYKKIITNKNLLKISTIDSFINSIFTGLVAPFYGIQEFKLDATINENYIPEILDFVLQDTHKDIYKDIFKVRLARNLKSFENLILSIINNRWIFHFIDYEAITNTPYLKQNNSNIEDFIEKEQNRLKDNFLSNIDKTLDVFYEQFIQFLKQKKKKFEPNKQFKTTFLNLFKELSDQDIEDLSPKEFIDEYKMIFRSDAIFNEKYKDWLSAESFWNGNSVFRGQKELTTEILEMWQQTWQIMADYQFYDKYLSEEFNLINLAKIIYEKYDEIKLKRDFIFTYDDISYYTFALLQNPEISILGKNEILNLFYERLSYKVRFLLIDEFQDTSILQWKIFYPLIKELIDESQSNFPSGVIIVGDEKQAIYGWRGGERNLMMRVSKLIFMKEKPASLTTSYRSEKQIINFINKIFDSDKNSNFSNVLEKNSLDWVHPKIECAKKESNGFIRAHFLNRYEIKDVREELSKHNIYELLVNEIESLIENKCINPKNTAIIARTNNELEEIGMILREKKIPFIKDSSNAIIYHRAVKPIYFLLNFFVYRDVYDLIKFLRSDAVLIDSKELKELLFDIKNHRDKNKYDLIQILANYAHPIFQKIVSIYKSSQHSISFLVKNIIEEFNIVGNTNSIFSAESDYNNIIKFFEVIKNYENTSESIGLENFLKFCRESEKSELLKQESSSEESAINLLSIHKSKGLEFETVFFLNDITNSNHPFDGLNIYTNFTEDYSYIDNFALSFNHNPILKYSSFSDIILNNEKNEHIEELNNYYVALTRTAKNLFIWLHYKLKPKFIDERNIEEIHSHFLEKLSENINVPALMLISILDAMKENILFNDDLHFVAEQGCLEKISEIKKEKTTRISNIDSKSNFFSFDAIPKKEISSEYENYLTYKKIKETATFGSAIHFYLSFIEFDFAKESKIAKNKLLQQYGLLLSSKKIEELISRVKNAINQYDSYFDKNLWTKCFNEFEIYDSENNVYRIDRLLLNENEKKALIIDYKTGKHEDEQLEKYKFILSNYPAFKENNWEIDTKFIEL